MIKNASIVIIDTYKLQQPLNMLALQQCRHATIVVNSRKPNNCFAIRSVNLKIFWQYIPEPNYFVERYRIILLK